MLSVGVKEERKVADVIIFHLLCVLLSFQNWWIHLLICEHTTRQADICIHVARTPRQMPCCGRVCTAKQTLWSKANKKRHAQRNRKQIRNSI